MLPYWSGVSPAWSMRAFPRIVRFTEPGCAPLKLALFQNEMMTSSFLSRQDKATQNTVYTVASPYALPCAHLLLPLLFSPTVLSPSTTPRAYHSPTQAKTARTPET